MEAGVDHAEQVRGVEAAIDEAKEEIKAKEVEQTIEVAREALGRRGEGGAVTAALVARARDCVAEAKRGAALLQGEARFEYQLEELEEELEALEGERQAEEARQGQEEGGAGDASGAGAAGGGDAWGDEDAGGSGGSGGGSGGLLSGAGSLVEEDIDVVSFGDSVHEEYSGNFDDDKSADSW